MTQLDSELLKKAVQVAVFYNNLAGDLEEIVEMFCMDAACMDAARARQLAPRDNSGFDNMDSDIPF